MKALEILKKLVDKKTGYTTQREKDEAMLFYREAIKELEALQNKNFTRIEVIGESGRVFLAKCDNNKYYELSIQDDGKTIKLFKKKGTEPNVLYNDWRLPTIQELLTLVNYNKCKPACNLEDTQPIWYWSITPIISDYSFAWVVSFGYGCGYWDDKSNSLLVRCVRNGENGLEWSATSKLKMTWNEAIEYASNLVAPVYYKG